MERLVLICNEFQTEDLINFDEPKFYGFGQLASWLLSKYRTDFQRWIESLDTREDASRIPDVSFSLPSGESIEHDRNINEVAYRTHTVLWPPKTARPVPAS